MGDINELTNGLATISIVEGSDIKDNDKVEECDYHRTVPLDAVTSTTTTNTTTVNFNKEEEDSNTEQDLKSSNLKDEKPAEIVTVSSNTIVESLISSNIDVKPQNANVENAYIDLTNSSQVINKTALIYDESMKDYWCTTARDHPERPMRIVSIYNKLVEEKITDLCVLLKSRYATEEEILLKHEKKHYDVVLSLKTFTKGQLHALEHQYDSIYFHENVTDCSLLSAGCTIELTEQVIQGKVSNGAAIVRPPGHHALAHCSMGFCHFNNVAVAAMVALTKYNLKRVVIVDWDVHYGNGIHKMFQYDPRVLYFSMHRYDNNLFWPSLVEGNYDAVGLNKGEGYNIHVAWNRSGMGDADYLYAFKKILMPVALEYEPELVLISSGFDSGKGDPLGGCRVTPNGYAHMTKQLMGLANGKVVLVLEGGYNLKTISESMLACVKTLLGKIPLEREVDKPCKSAVESIKNTHGVHKKYWTSLENVDFDDVNTEKHQDIIEIESSSSEDEDSMDYLG